MPKTKINSKQLFEKRNTSDVFDREVIIGLLRILNKRLTYEQIWNESANDIENVTVPFFFDFGGGSISSERFIQDNYTFFTSDECTSIGIKKIDGNFDMYPQGRVSLGGISINAGEITNRFAMGTYTKIVDGELKTFTAYLYSMPLSFTFNVEIRAENVLTGMKIDGAIREFFYKNKTFHFDYKGVTVPCRVGFPENAFNGQQTQFTMGASTTEPPCKLSLSLQCETYHPVFDPFTERPADSSIGGVGFNIWINNEPEPKERTGPIYWTTDLDSINTLVSGQDIFLEWNYSYMDRDLLEVDLSYVQEGDDIEHLISSMPNHLFYNWHVPEDLTDNTPIDIMIANTDEVSVLTAPEIYIYPDPETRTVEPGNVYIKNKGFFATPTPDYVIDGIISYETSNGEIKEYPVEIKTHNYMIDTEVGIKFNCFVYENSTDPRRIKLILRDHNQKENMCESGWISVF